MKNNLICILIFLTSLTVYCQVKDMGGPRSFGLQLNKNASSVFMPSFDMDQVQREDAINDLDNSKPFRFGYSHQVNLGLASAGEWHELDNGDRLWRINIISKGAKTMNFIFDTYQVPDGAMVYLYNNDRTDVLGAYTNVMNREDQMLGTWMVAGENIWIEYYEPFSVRGKGALNIGKVIHGYRSVTDQEAKERAEGKSGNCNHDVNCPIGSDFEALKERLKHSIAFVIMDGFVCSGSLINNTDNDGAPYFLTANHCDAGPESGWAFRFNWINADPICAGPNDSATGPTNQTTSGATRLAVNSKSDFRLLRLDGGLDTNWDLEWAGWDRTDVEPAFTVGIHHPSGDIMKVCRDNNPSRKVVSSFNGNSTAEFWIIDDENNTGGWEIGVTERGSSGSPLFDPLGRIIGKLSAGDAGCNGTIDNDAFDIYGRFAVSWDFGNDSSTRLREWLDPSGTGQETLDMLSQELEALGVTDNTFGNEIAIFPVPATTHINVKNDAGKTLEYSIFNLVGQEVASGKITFADKRIDLSTQDTGVYFLSLINDADGTQITKKFAIKR